MGSCLLPLLLRLGRETGRGRTRYRRPMPSKRARSSRASGAIRARAGGSAAGRDQDERTASRHALGGLLSALDPRAHGSSALGLSALGLSVLGGAGSDLLAGLAPCPVCELRPAGSAGVCAPCIVRLREALAVQPRQAGDVLWLGPYAGAWQRLVHALKYRGARRLAHLLGELLACKAEDAGWCAGETRAQLVAHVPTASSRLAGRGYDQAELLARSVALRLGLPQVAALRRVRATAKLAGQGRAARAAILSGAFESRYLAGRNVLLVDDVLTTGATLEAARSALQAAGAGTVRCALIARTAPRDPGGEADPA